MPHLARNGRLSCGRAEPKRADENVSRLIDGEIVEAGDPFGREDGTRLTASDVDEVAARKDEPAILVEGETADAASLRDQRLDRPVR